MSGSNGPWTEEQEEFLATNVGFLSITAMADILGKTMSSVRSKAACMKLDTTVHSPLQELVGDLEFVPDGTTSFKTRGGCTVLRIPSSTPGIVSRTVHTSFNASDARTR